MEETAVGKDVKTPHYDPVMTCLQQNHDKGPREISKQMDSKIQNQLTIDDHCTQRPILVGYAFGPKKMSTMSVVMAEASMAASTVVTNLPSQFCTFHRSKCNDVKDSGGQDDGDDDDDENDNCHGHGHGHENEKNCHLHTSQYCSSSSSSSSSSSFSSLVSWNANCASGDEKRTSTTCPFCDTLSVAETIRNEIHSHGQQDVDAFGTDKLPTVCIFPSSFFGNSSTLTTTTTKSATLPPASSPEIDSSFQQKKARTSLEEGSFVTATSASSASCSGLEHSCSICPLEYLYKQQGQGQQEHLKEEQLISTSPSQNLNDNASFHSLPRHFQPIKVSFVPLNLDHCLEDQHCGKFDAILHKMTEDILCISQLEHRNSCTLQCSSTNESEIQALQRIRRLNEYKEKYPSCCLIDHPVNVQKLMSRRDIASTLDTCLKGVYTPSGMAVRTPRYTIVSDFHGDSQNIARDIDDSNLQYPLIVKPLTAAGTKQSHKMGVLLGRHGLSDIHGQGPFLLQEYANHDCVLYKVYVLGNKVWVFQRPSLPNLPLGEANLIHHGGKGFVEFDSQRPYPTLDDFGISVDQHDANIQGVEIDDIVTVSDIRPVADSIRKAFALDLFGFDVLVTQVNNDRASKEMLVVDVNYFPSYKEVTNFSQLLAQYLAQCGIEGRLRSYDALR